MGNILWVDDMATTLNVQQKVIENAGHSVDMSSSADEAAELLKKKQYELTMVDLMMPCDGLFDELQTMGGMRTGVFFAQYVRLHFPEMPIVILSISSPSTYDDELLFSNGIKRFRKQDFPGKSILDLIHEVEAFEPDYKAMDVLELKPGMFGLKVDIKNFVKYWKSRKSKTK